MVMIIMMLMIRRRHRDDNNNNYYYYYLRQAGNVFAFVCLQATLLKKFLTDLDEIFRIGRK